MTARLTPQQAKAVDHRGTSVVLASGAGCGKTHVLTARYLAHLERDGAAVPEVVAITFTERAAREMRGRIRAAVRRHLDAADPTSPSFTAWRRHLRDLETAPITTIHSFCGTLLRQHAVAAGLDPGFDVLEDALAANLRADALRDGLHRLLLAESPLGEDLREIVILFGWAAVVEAVDAALPDADPPAWARWADRPPHEVAAHWLTEVRAKLLPGWVSYLCTASPKISGCLSLLRGIEGASLDARVAVARILSETPNLHRCDDLAAAVDELVELAQVKKLGKKHWPDEAAYEAVKAAFEGYRKELADRLALFADEPDGVTEAAAVGQRFLRVAAEARRGYQERKRRAGALDFQDLLVLARDLLRDHPDVTADLRRRYKHLLLDELQDTDPVQLELVERLAGAGLHHGKLFAVGDAKQSIYRFRGADVALFDRLRAAVPEPGRMVLSKNFRSQPGVLRFVNALCGGWFPGEEPLATHKGETGAGANVELLWAVPGRAAGLDPAEHGPGEEASSPGQSSGRDKPGRSPKESVADVRSREADAIARRVVELIESKEPRVLENDALRPVQPKDVTILFRSMSHVAAYEAALRRHGLDYYLVGGRAFFAQQEVYDLLNLLRAVENPQDGPALAGALRSPFCGLSDEALFLLGTHPGGLWAGLFDAERFATLPADQKPAVERGRRFLVRWRGLKDRLPIARLLNAVFADSGYDAATQFEFLGDRKLANLWKLADLAREFDRTGFGLPEFVARLADWVARQPREEQAATQPENADVVKLMSIHQAKGLEFPVVVVPDLGATGRGDVHPVLRWHRELGGLPRLPADLADDDPPFGDFPDKLGRVADQLADWREDLRVLYVACTRAKDLLVLSAGLPEGLSPTVPGLPTPPPKGTASHWMLALAERFDLRTGRCVDGTVSVAVRLTEPGAESVLERRADGGGEEPKPTRCNGWASDTSTQSTIPAIVSLPAVERFLCGEPVATLADDIDGWEPLRERLAPLSPAETVFHAVFARWAFADVDGWQPHLTDALADLGDDALAGRLADDLPPLFRRFAESDARGRLLAAETVLRDVEFLLDLRHVADRGDLLAGGKDPLPAVRGVIDLLYRDAAGWHVAGLHLFESPGRGPWADRRPGLAAALWAAREHLGELPRTVGLIDLVTGDWQAEPAKRVKFPAALSPLLAAVKSWASRSRQSAA